MLLQSADVSSRTRFATGFVKPGAGYGPQTHRKPIRFQSRPGDAYKAQLMEFGASEVFAQGLVDMHAAKDNGLDNADCGRPRTRLRQPFDSGERKF